MSESQEFIDALGPEAAEALFEWAAVQGATLDWPQLLTNGQSGACVMAVVERAPRRRPRRLILKLCPPDDDGDEVPEPGRHLAALRDAPDYAKRHLVKFVHEPLRVGPGQWLVFQGLAGNLTETPPLSVLVDDVVDGRRNPRSLCDADTLAEVCGALVRSVLKDWVLAGGRAADCEVVDPVTFLGWHLGHRHLPGGSLHRWVTSHAPHLLDGSARWITLGHDEVPNPLVLASDRSMSGHRRVRVLKGPAHGDLHPENVLIPLKNLNSPKMRQVTPGSYRLIDLSRYSAHAPLSRDPVHLVLSIVARHLEDISPSQREALIGLLVDPSDDGSGDLVPTWLKKVVVATAGATPNWIKRSFLTEWREQSTLSLVGCALVFTGRRTTRDAHRDWFFRLAAQAAYAFLMRPGLSGTGHGARQTAPGLPMAGPLSLTPSAEQPRIVIRPQLSPAPHRAELPPPPPQVSAGRDVEKVGGRGAPDHHEGGRPGRRLPRLVAPELRKAADELGERVRSQWEAAAAGRRLRSPGPVRVRWAKANRPVVGPLSDALSDANGTGGPALVPGATALTAERLGQGDVSQLLSVYCGLPKGRLVIMGRPGAGKTAAAIRLVLDLLDYRATCDDTERGSIAVPVILTPHDWDPESQPVGRWVAQRLVADYPLLATREHGPDVANRLVEAGLVALVLDGLDDMSERARPVALRALDEQVGFRIVVVSRSDEMEAAAAGGHLSRAVAIELQPVDPGEAADYLVRCAVDPMPPDWQRLVDGIRDDAAAPAAQALDSPLMLGLVRDTYRHSDDDADELLDRARFATRDAVEDHLLDRVLPAAYSAKPGDPASPYSLQVAQRWLRHLAHRMDKGNTRDLAWWRLADAEPWWRQVLVTGPLIGTLSGLLFLVVGLFGGQPLAGFAAGFVLGPAAALFEAQALNGDGRLERAARAWRIGGGYVISSTLTGLLTGGLLVGDEGALIGAGVGLAVGLSVGLLGVLWVVHVFGFDGRPTAAADGLLTPRACWDEDGRQARVCALLLGLMNTVTFALVGGPVSGLALAPLLLVVLAAMVVVPTAAVTLSARARMTLATVRLWIARKGPVRLIRFLEDARERDVLRVAGPVYQFRHARLQDVLARSHPEVDGRHGDVAEGPAEP